MCYNKGTKKEREDKTMTREQMMDDVIRKYGFEVKTTIAFCRMCERGNVAYTQIETRYNELMKR